MAKFNISVVGFRILIDVITQNNFDWTPSFQAHFSSFFFYFTFSCIFYVAKVNRFYNRPLIIGLIGITIEILSENLVELIAQYIVLGTTSTLATLNGMIIIAISHSIIVLSFFNMTTN